jgi:hypothetical protein
MTPLSRLLLLTLAALSTLTTAVAGGWPAGVLPVPLVEADDALALVMLSPTALAWLVLAAALLGLVSALLLLAAGRLRDPRVLLPAAAVQLVVFGVAVQGIGAIALAGYLLACARWWRWWCWPSPSGASPPVPSADSGAPAGDQPDHRLRRGGG